jgi:hypothetical protein
VEGKAPNTPAELAYEWRLTQDGALITASGAGWGETETETTAATPAGKERSSRSLASAGQRIMARTPDISPPIAPAEAFARAPGGTVRFAQPMVPAEAFSHAPGGAVRFASTPISWPCR